MAALREELGEEEIPDDSEDPQAMHIAMIRTMIEDSDLEEDEERLWMKDSEREPESEGEDDDEDRKDKVFDLKKVRIMAPPGGEGVNTHAHTHTGGYVIRGFMVQQIHFI